VVDLNPIRYFEILQATTHTRMLNILNPIHCFRLRPEDPILGTKEWGHPTKKNVTVLRDGNTQYFTPMMVIVCRIV
jgi:hypothetical protein